MPVVKKIGRFILDTKLWKPTHASILYKHYRNKGLSYQTKNEKHITAALDWLKRAQDITGDGGGAGRYLLNRGWTLPYPETSGYIVPTFLEAAKRFDDPDFIKRAERIINFLYSVQMDSGAFPGGEYRKELPSHPIVFNTGQIIIGLVAWYQMTKDEACLNSLRKAAEWLIEVQEDDGSWKKFTYGNIKTAYHTRVAWPLAMYGKLVGDDKSLAAADRYFEWILNQTNPDTGWVSRMDFDTKFHTEERSITHTLAYTYRGLLEYALLMDRQDIIKLVTKMAENITKKYESHNYISGVLNSQWNNTEDFSCLTGNCQLSIIWLKLYEQNKDERLYRATEKLMDFVKRFQNLDSSNDGIRGGISGSAPIWGSYIRFGYPNWAAKFFIDALMLLDRTKNQFTSYNSEAANP